MAHSLTGAFTPPDGAFERAVSHTRFASETTSTGTWQSLTRGQESQRLRVAYQIGSGSHAVGFLAQVGDHLFRAGRTDRLPWYVVALNSRGVRSELHWLSHAETPRKGRGTHVVYRPSNYTPRRAGRQAEQLTGRYRSAMGITVAPPSLQDLH